MLWDDLDIICLMDTPFGTLDQGLGTFSKYKLEYFRFLQLLHAGI